MTPAERERREVEELKKANAPDQQPVGAREARENVIQCARTMNADNEIDGWQGNANINMALDAYEERVTRPLKDVLNRLALAIERVGDWGDETRVGMALAEARTALKGAE